MLVQVFYAWQLFGVRVLGPKLCAMASCATEPYTARHGNAAFDAKASGLECRRAIEINDAALSFGDDGCLALPWLRCRLIRLNTSSRERAGTIRDRVASIGLAKADTSTMSWSKTIARSNSVVLRCSGSSRSARPQLPWTGLNWRIGSGSGSPRSPESNRIAAIC
jgi:hypothetical protein